MQERFRGIRISWRSRGIEELLPETKYVDETGQQVLGDAADLFVRGTITKVAPGVAYKGVPDGDSRVAQEVAYESSAAEERTVHLTIRVDRVLGGRANGSPIVVVLRIGKAQFDDAASALRSSEVVLPLIEPAAEPSFYNVPTGAYGLMGLGSVLTVVEDGGRLSFPFISDAARRRDLLSKTRTYQDLVAESQAPGRIVQLRRDGGDPYRPSG
jgi:hypothetical protein